MKEDSSFWRLGVFALCVAALSMGGCQRRSAEQPDENAGDENSHLLTMMSFNICRGVGCDGASDLQEGALGELPQCAEIIKAANPDWVAIQDVDRLTKRSGHVDQVAELARLCEMRGHFVKKEDLEEGESGLAVLSKDDPIAVSKILMQGSQHTRCVEIVEFADYIVACTHFPSKEFLRVRSAETVCLNLAGRGKPVFLAGDINAVPESPTVIKLKEKFTILNDAGKPTFRSDRPTRCIDYIMVDSAHADCVEVVSQQVVQAAKVSDHCAIVVKAKLRGQDVKAR